MNGIFLVKKSFWVNSEKRNIIYFLPRDGYFKVALVSGDNAVNKIVESKVSEVIKNEFLSAKKMQKVVELELT